MMRRNLPLTLSLACLLGCSASGNRWNPFVTESSPQTPPAQIAQSPTAPEASQEKEFSFAKMFQLAGFQKPETPAPSLLPKEVVNLGEMINNVTARSAELNVNDPPEVTRQKAQAIVETLKPWDSTLAASHSTGFVTNEMAQALNSGVGQIRAEAQKLIQYVPNPQTIAAIQQLAASLNATFGNISAILKQGSAASQAWLGANGG